MKASLQAFLAGILDYAGLFPPASLSLEDALARYDTYRGQLLLGGFVLNVARVTALPEGEWPLVLVGTPVPGAMSGPRLAEADVEAVAGELGDRLGRDVTVTSVEIACAEVPSGQVEIYRQLGEGLQVFYETRDLANLRGAGLKIRAGGVTADKFPTARELAALLASWGPLEVPLKLTAGLHQPLPHYDPALEVRHHGFLNVFTAAMVARRFGAGADALKEVLGLDRPSDFVFGDADLRVRDFSLSLDDLVALRQVVRGFGSCSFDEPMQTLKAHGFLED